MAQLAESIPPPREGHARIIQLQHISTALLAGDTLGAVSSFVQTYPLLLVRNTLGAFSSDQQAMLPLPARGTLEEAESTLTSYDPVDQVKHTSL